MVSALRETDAGSLGRGLRDLKDSQGSDALGDLCMRTCGGHGEEDSLACPERATQRHRDYPRVVSISSEDNGRPGRDASEAEVTLADLRAAVRRQRVWDNGMVQSRLARFQCLWWWWWRWWRPPLVCAVQRRAGDGEGIRAVTGTALSPSLGELAATLLGRPGSRCRCQASRRCHFATRLALGVRRSFLPSVS